MLSPHQLIKTKQSSLPILTIINIYLQVSHHPLSLSQIYSHLSLLYSYERITVKTLTARYLCLPLTFHTCFSQYGLSSSLKVGNASRWNQYLTSSLQTIYQPRVKPRLRLHQELMQRSPLRHHTSFLHAPSAKQTQQEPPKTSGHESP